MNCSHGCLPMSSLLSLSVRPYLPANRKDQMSKGSCAVWPLTSLDSGSAPVCLHCQ